MPRYAPLFRVEVGHEFFAGDPCPAAELVLDPRSSELARRAGLVVRDSPGVLTVFFDLEARERLALFASDQEEPFRLDLRLTAGDPAFADCTAPGPVRPREVLAFSSRNAVPDPRPGVMRLSVCEGVSEKDFFPLDSDRVTSAAARRELLLRPMALIRMELADDSGNFIEPGTGKAGSVFRLDFRARATYWRYLLLGALARSGSSITDLDRETEFESIGEEQLPGGRRAWSLRSTTPLPLAERSTRRFQLRLDGANGSTGGRILIRRLPVAGAGGVHRDTIDGRVSFVSDILVNG